MSHLISKDTVATMNRARVVVLAVPLLVGIMSGCSTEPPPSELAKQACADLDGFDGTLLRPQTTEQADLVETVETIEGSIPQLEDDAELLARAAAQDDTYRPASLALSEFVASSGTFGSALRSIVDTDRPTRTQSEAVASTSAAALDAMSNVAAECRIVSTRGDGWLTSARTRFEDHIAPWFLLLLPPAAFLWGVHSWLRGGSVVRVELKLGKLDPDGNLAGAASKWWSKGETPESILGIKVNSMHVDVAIVTVRNRGRTPSTVTNPGLYFTPDPVHYGGALLEPGEVSSRVRIEAHDSRQFVFPIEVMAKHARNQVRQSRTIFGLRSLKARAQVTTGTGRVRRSSWKSAWKVGPEGASLGGGTPTVEAQLFTRYLDKGADARDLVGDIRLVMHLLKEGKEPVEIAQELAPIDQPEDLARNLRLTRLATRARQLLDKSKNASEP